MYQKTLCEGTYSLGSMEQTKQVGFILMGLCPVHNNFKEKRFDRVKTQICYLFGGWLFFRRKTSVRTASSMTYVWTLENKWDVRPITYLIQIC